MVAIRKGGANPHADDLATGFLVPVVDCVLDQFAVRPPEGVVAANDVRCELLGNALTNCEVAQATVREL